MFNNIVVVVVVFTVVMCTCLGDQSPSEILTGICNSSNSLFIECADLNVTQKSLFSDLLHSTTGASDEVENSWKNPLEELSALPDMPHVAGLYLHGNAIRVIQSAAFHRLTALSHLDLSNNNLSRVGFLSAPAVQLPLIYLDLGYNQISSIDADAFHSIPHLKRLKLNNNPIVSLDGHTGLAITNLENLMELNLAETELESIPDALFERSGRKLRFLDLHGNHLTQVPRALQNAVQLRELNLNANDVTTLDATSLVGLSNLVKLEVSHLAGLRQIQSNSFTPLRNLKYIDCSNNYQLETIHPNAFHNVSTLEEFEFHSNGVASIPPYLLPWGSLQFYDVQNNSNICTTLKVVICVKSRLVWELADDDKALIITCLEDDERYSYSNLTGCPNKPSSTTPFTKDLNIICSDSNLDGCNGPTEKDPGLNSSSSPCLCASPMTLMLYLFMKFLFDLVF